MYWAFIVLACWRRCSTRLRRGDSSWRQGRLSRLRKGRLSACKYVVNTSSLFDLCYSYSNRLSFTWLGHTMIEFTNSKNTYLAVEPAFPHFLSRRSILLNKLKVVELALYKWYCKMAFGDWVPLQNTYAYFSGMIIRLDDT